MKLRITLCLRLVILIGIVAREAPTIIAEEKLPLVPGLSQNRPSQPADLLKALSETAAVTDGKFLDLSLEEAVLQSLQAATNEPRLDCVVIPHAAIAGRVPFIRLSPRSKNEETSALRKRVDALVFDVESAYWKLFCCYHELDSRIAAQEHAMVSWRRVERLLELGGAPGFRASDEPHARLRWHQTRSATIRTSFELRSCERQLRLLLGLGVCGSESLRPSSEPVVSGGRVDRAQLLKQLGIESECSSQITARRMDSTRDGLRSEDDRVPEVSVESVLGARRSGTPNSPVSRRHTFEIHQSVDEVASTQERLIQEGLAVTASKRLFARIRRMYDAGTESHLRLLSASSDMANAQSAYCGTVVENALAVARLRRVAGILTDQHDGIVMLPAAARIEKPVDGDNRNLVRFTVDGASWHRSPRGEFFVRRDGEWVPGTP